MTVPHFDADAIRRVLPVSDAIELLRAAFAEPAVHLPRTVAPVAGGDLLVMPAVHGRWAGVKSIVVQPANAGTDRPVIGGSYVLLDALDARAVATFDGGALTALRTPAVSALAVDSLCPANVSTAVVVGRGVQGRAHAAAIRAVRPGLHEVRVLGREVSSPDSAPALKNADIVVTATSAVEPLLHDAMVGERAVLVAVGSYRADAAELSSELVGTCDVWVDDLAAARDEAGDLVQAAIAGWSWSAVCGDVHDLACMPASAAPRTRGRSLFKSVGLAFEDLVIASAVWDRLRVEP